jgi:5-methyltetrahydropteroyltriglutamate--homocysteine methyltransferase
MVTAANLGFPRVGLHRELKSAVEGYWKGRVSKEELLRVAADLRAAHWKLQRDAGTKYIPSNEFSLYDHVLDTIALVGAVPERYGHKKGQVSLETYFAMARGRQAKGVDVTAMEMTKWFDTNYHYIVPELSADMEFSLSSTKPMDDFSEAKALGIHTRPVLVGPVTFLMLGKVKDGDVKLDALLERLLPVYAEVLKGLEKAGADWVQIDEPCLALDLSDAAKKAYMQAYETLATAGKLKIMLTTYFGDLRENLALVGKLPVAGLHLDLVRGQLDIEALNEHWPQDRTISFGLVDGRNIWKTDLEKALGLARHAVSWWKPENVQIAPSCSLLHCPVDLDAETRLDKELKSWLAFAKQKLAEVKLLAEAAAGRENEAALEENEQAMENRRSSKRIHDSAVKERLRAVTLAMSRRQHPFIARIEKQQARLNLPPLPTTTIGSLPQTQDVRQARARSKKGEMSAKEYEKFLEEKIAEAVRWQEEIGIDVLVHGEFERNDMVEYFGEQMKGFAFTANGWVQSYGSRCVKPPIIYGDVSRPKPMTVRWSKFAQSLTGKPMKGMLTGPVTILQWSFVRDDQPRSETCRQIALAIRDEVADLESAGIGVIQIDEPALREGQPLRKSDWKKYLDWAVDAFRLSASGVKDKTQIHTHMCYSEFNDIIEAIAALDADVISIEASRSDMELLRAFAHFRYPNHIGPGVYDIHSPRVPSQKEMEELIEKAMAVLKPDQLWINPDCGLKTRGWEEVRPALERMVACARSLRAKLEAGQKAGQSHYDSP